jgi:hypothetical protein
MALVDPGGHPADPVQQCFNSQLPAAQASSGNCGISPSNPSVGEWNLDFGFRVDDRFVVATPLRTPRDQLSASPNGSPSSSIGVTIYSDFADGLTNGSFYIVVF